jgi:hypothetical protein
MHFGSKSLPQPGDLSRFFDASLRGRPLWPFREHLITVSSPSDNCAGGERILVGPRISVHRHKLGTKQTRPSSLFGSKWDARVSGQCPRVLKTKVESV